MLIDTLGLDVSRQPMHDERHSNTSTTHGLNYQFRKPRTTSLDHQGVFGGSWGGDFDGLLRLVNAELAEAKNESQKNKNKRSAAFNARGRQLTPAFVEAVLRDVLADPWAEAGERAVTEARGGFTDVGLHTGGERRNTAWPLARLLNVVILNIQLNLEDAYLEYPSFLLDFAPD